METLNELRFALSDRIHDVEIGLGHVPLSLLGEFPKEVSEFLKGSSREIDPSKVLVSVEEGSLKLVVTGLLAATTLWADLEKLQTTGSLNFIDVKRAAVLERWQETARQNPNRKYKVADASARVRLDIDSSSDLRKVEDVWIPVEKYVTGRITDWGGKRSPNVHVEVEDGSVLVVAATQELLANEDKNRLYRHTVLHISAEENLLNRSIRSPRLVKFFDSQLEINENEFQRTINSGTAAWANVSNVTNWLEELRGGV